MFETERMSSMLSHKSHGAVSKGYSPVQHELASKCPPSLAQTSQVSTLLSERLTGTTDATVESLHCVETSPPAQ